MGTAQTHRQVAIDPSTVGLDGAIGDIVSGPGGAIAWQKYGPGTTDWRRFPGILAGDLVAVKSGPINFLSTGADGEAEFEMPVIPGKEVFPAGPARVVVANRAGTASGNWNFSIGNEASTYANVLGGAGTTGAAAANFNASLAAPATLPYSFSQTLVGSHVPATAKLRVKTRGALGGATTMAGYMELVVAYRDA